METPDGKMQTITVPAGNFAVGKRQSLLPKGSSAGRGRKRPAAFMLGSGAGAQPQADRSLFSLVNSVVSFA